MSDVSTTLFEFSDAFGAGTPAAAAGAGTGGADPARLESNY